MRKPREFTAKPAERNQVPVLMGLFGASGSGKTLSALRLATGIQSVVGGEIYGVDSEADRMLAYADDYKFKHVPFDAPFGSIDYLDVLRWCVGKGASIVVVDSMSHEHSGEGGYLLTQEAEMERMAGDDWKKRERVKFAAWIKPAANRSALINGFLQLRCNFIFCFRAKEKTKPTKNSEGKIEPVEMGFTPIGGEEFVYEMTASALLLPRSDGVPTWKTEHIGEKLAMKLPKQFKGILDDGKPLSEDHGRAMAQWARGGSTERPREQPKLSITERAEAAALALKEAADMAKLEARWKRCTPILAELEAAGLGIPLDALTAVYEKSKRDLTTETTAA